jgi:hypothetical protein
MKPGLRKTLLLVGLGLVGGALLGSCGRCLGAT